MALALRKGLEWALGFKFRYPPSARLVKSFITLKGGGSLSLAIYMYILAYIHMCDFHMCVCV